MGNGRPRCPADSSAIAPAHINSESTMTGGASCGVRNGASGTIPLPMSRKQTPTHGTRSPGGNGPAKPPCPRAQSRREHAQRGQFRRHAALDIRIGDKVFHEKFGNGTVKAQEGNKLEIEFDSGGFKRVLDSFVKRI
jgi:DNA helicase-2/ATP-dependent DNA helicase PcrA